MASTAVIADTITTKAITEVISLTLMLVMSKSDASS